MRKYLDFLSVDFDAVEFLDSLFGALFVPHGDKGEALASVEDIIDFTASPELALEDVSGTILADAVHKQLLGHGGRRMGWIAADFVEVITDFF